MKKPFFKIALAQAYRIIGKPGRMLQLAAQLLNRLYKMDHEKLRISAVKERLQIMGRLVVSYVKGQYREIPVSTLLKIVAALIYFLNPIDLIPDAIVGVGLVDDLAVLTWVYKSAAEEVQKFIAWENGRMKG